MALGLGAEASPLGPTREAFVDTSKSVALAELDQRLDTGASAGVGRTMSAARVSCASTSVTLRSSTNRACHFAATRG